MVQFRSLLAFFPLILSSTASLLPRQATTTQVYKFPSTASIEGIGIRTNGQILITRMDAGEIWQYDPTTKAAAKLISISGVTATAGIVELAPDVWYIVGGKYSGGANTAGSWGIYKLNLNGASPALSTVKIVPESKLWNGLTKFDNDTLLIGDAQAGSVFKMSASTGTYSAIITANSEMTPGGGIPFGLDGIRYYNGSLYFTNISKNTFSRVPIDASGKAGTVVKIYSNTPGDDLSFDSSGNAYIATNLQNSVIKVDAAGKITKLATVSGSTCTAFGRTEATKNTLYVGGGSSVMSFPVTF
ncbi:hypothetical protein HYFRA_00010962 [Hymenoscyphus fraxineus]|uniref:SMP-30/Gluconolactonase/LRE-like region domain-containing protein n=1 Tax=Hymenoscyphus fraxineus TaxID=746836 RepID=A0A9N9KZ37_9HELO|nr:hypothetical protein HYFRA_00010962 [Hymenoscyphus fraxineus]